MASRRGYLTQTELAEFADIVINDSAEADDQISQAEEMIDAYLGPQDRFLRFEYRGEVSSASTTVIVDSGSGNNMDVIDNFYAGAEIEILSGALSGEHRSIVSSSRSAKSITVSVAFSGTPATGVMFRIYQLAKFPRHKDVRLNRAGDLWVKSIPDALRRATAAQVAFVIEKGPGFFAGDASQLIAEGIDNYNYQRGGTMATPTVALIAPRARTLLRGYVNRTGEIC